MGVVQIVTNVLECDGCQAIYGAPSGYPTGMEVRAAAYAEGWRFPPLAPKGKESARSTTSDVCPACMPEWTPKERRPEQRRATDAELRTWTGATK